MRLAPLSRMQNFAVIIQRAGLAILMAVGAHVHATADVIGQAAESARQNSQAAQANRNLADQLYRQALQDHDNAWSSFPPNVGLLSKALQESKDAKAADDQAKEFARGAMHSIHTGGNSGDFNLQKYGVLSEQQLSDLANKSSPYMPAAEKTLGKYGMELTPDKMSIKTPLGTLPLDMSMNVLEKGLRGIASKLGYNPDDVSSGLKAGERARDAMASKIMNQLGSSVSTRTAGGPGASVAPESSGAGFGEGKRDDKPVASANAAAENSGEGVPSGTSGDNRQEELQRNRKAFLEKMGVGILSADPLGASHQDIFKMVHLRYQALRSEGEFIETDAIVELAQSRAGAAPKANSAPLRSPASFGPIQPMIESPAAKISSR